MCRATPAVPIFALLGLGLLAGCPPPPPGEIAPVMVSLGTAAGAPVAVCWSDDELYTSAGSMTGTGDAGTLLTPADVLYRVHRNPSGTAFVYTVDDLARELYGNDAQTNAMAAGCPAGFEFALLDVPPGGAGRYAYSVCRVVSGEVSGCSVIAEIDWGGGTDGGTDAATGTDGGADAGTSTDAAPGTDAACDGGAGGSC
ncbi:MAG TPA: hypothetical protein VG389_23990 [Myxococcota bacterium]|jgi:hypothetical protein|nr:hypothetical protein [Myxococcota bacterium]